MLACEDAEYSRAGRRHHAAAGRREEEKEGAGGAAESPPAGSLPGKDGGGRSGSRAGGGSGGSGSAPAAELAPRKCKKRGSEGPLPSTAQSPLAKKRPLRRQPRAASRSKRPRGAGKEAAEAAEDQGMVVDGGGGRGSGRFGDGVVIVPK